MPVAANTRSAIGAGFLATVVLTFLMYAGPMMGMPRMDIGSMLGSLLIGETPTLYGGAWWAGLIWHFVNGTIIFPLIYTYLLYPVLTGSPSIRGIEFGLILWFLAQIIVNPMMGMGVFAANAPAPMLAVTGSLIGHIVYGWILGGLTGVAIARPVAPGRQL